MGTKSGEKNTTCSSIYFVIVYYYVYIIYINIIYIYISENSFSLFSLFFVFSLFLFIASKSKGGSKGAVLRGLRHLGKNQNGQTLVHFYVFGVVFLDRTRVFFLAPKERTIYSPKEKEFEVNSLHQL